MKSTDITQDFENLYYAKSALVVYQTKGNDPDVYVEHFDMDANGNPVNAHPLTVREAENLAKSLMLEQEKESAFLKPRSVLPNNILSLDPSTENGTVIWHTKAQERELYFVDSLGIPNGNANVPPMLWKASKSSLTVYAITTNRRPVLTTKLYHAPFFNVYENGRVCLGTIRIDIKNSASVEEFIQAWEHYFFNSYFSHMISAGNNIKGNCLMLWKKLITEGGVFPTDILIPNRLTLKKLLS